MKSNMALEPSIDLGFQYIWEPGQSSNTVVLLHGTGGDEYDLLGLGRSIAPGTNLLSPRGKVLENGQCNRFFRRLSEGIFDEEDIKLRSAELAEFIVNASNAYSFDADNVWALGFSNGANIAAATMLLHPSVFCGALLLSPMLPLTPEKSPDLKGRQVFIGAGQADPVASPNQVGSLADLLTNCGAAVQTNYYPIGHRIEAKEIEDARVWYALKG